MDATAKVFRVWTRRRDGGYYSPGVEEFYDPSLPSGSLCDVLLGDDGPIRGVVISRGGFIECASAKKEDQEAFFHWLSFLTCYWIQWRTC